LRLFHGTNKGRRSSLVTIGGNGFFYGTEADRSASHANGQLPMVVMSHGAGGNVD